MTAFLSRVLVIAYPIVEILLIFWVGRTIGWGWTLLLLAAGLGIGLLLMRAAGITAFRAVAGPAQRAQPYVEIDETTGTAQTIHPDAAVTPEDIERAGTELRQSGWLFVSGVLFAIPGFLTDVAGAVLLLPPARRLLAARGPRRAGPAIVVVGETIVTDESRRGEPEGPPVIRGEILPPNE